MNGQWTQVKSHDGGEFRAYTALAVELTYGGTTYAFEKQKTPAKDSKDAAATTDAATTAAAPMAAAAAVLRIAQRRHPRHRDTQQQGSQRP